MIFLQEIAACIKKKEEKQLVYEEMTWHDLESRLINIQPTTKVLVIGVDRQKEHYASEVKWNFKFDYYEVLNVRDGYVSKLKLYTTHQP